MSSGVATLPGRVVPLFGRHEVVDEITRQLQSAAGGAGRGVLLIGHGGVGKTAVLRNSIETALGLGFQTLMGRSLPSDVPQPFSLIQDLLRSAHHPLEPGRTSAFPAPSLPMFLAPFEADRPPALAQTDGAGGPSREYQEADWLLARLGAPVEWVDASRSLLLGRLSDFFVSLAKQYPLLLAIDDLHFADTSSLEFLQQFASELTRAPIVILATTVPDAEAPQQVVPALDTFGASSNVRTLKLRPLTESELGEYVRWILNGRDPGRDNVMRWFTQTEGNPLFTEHLVRATMGLGTAASIQSSGSGRDLAEILQERVRSLAEAEKRVLVYAAVLGKEFDFSSLAAASHQEEERLSESLDRLVQGGLLREKGGEVYEFVSETVRADVYAELTETRRRILHRAAAHALESRGTASDYELARQYYLGRDDAQAVVFNRRAAGLAASAFAFDAAVLHLERALECERRLPSHDLTVELRLLIELGRFLDELGNLRRSEEILRDAVARCRTESGHEPELALALLGLAQTRSDLSEYPSALELATEAFEIVQRLGNQRELMAAHRVLGVAYWRLGELAEAEAHQRKALAIAETDGTSRERGHTLVDLANTYIQRGEGGIPEALTLYERAAGLFAAGEDHSARSRVLMNRSLLHHNAGRMPEALADVTEALEAAEKSRSPIWIGYCSLNLAQFQAESRDLPAARQAIDRSAQILEPLGDRLAKQQIRMIRGMIAEEEGDYRGANDLYTEALQLARDLTLRPEQSEMLFRLAHLAHLQSDTLSARQYLQAAREAGVLTLRGDLIASVEELDGVLAREA